MDGDHLDADRIHQSLLEKAKQDERLSPLLPLLGHTAVPGLAGDSQDPTPSESVRTALFTFPDSGEFANTLTLEPWEVERVIGSAVFRNWVATVEYEPAYTLVVRSIPGIKAVVKWASIVEKRVRVAGFRHTWSHLFSTPDDIIISFIPPNLRDRLPYDDPPANWKTELQGVTIVPSVNSRHPPPGHAFAKVMAGTTNNQFREWCHANGSWALPFNVVVLAVTMGGTNATICHGAGLSTSTLSDLVVEVGYIDASGVEQRVSDPTELKAASGCFGLLGIVTSITLQMEEMTIAEMRPTQVPVVLAIPPPEGHAIPKVIQKQMKEANITDEDIANARKEWIRRCEEDHFHEWFWFPYQKNAWVNTWKRRPKLPEDVTLPGYPHLGIDRYEEKQKNGAFAVSVAGMGWLPGPEQTYSFGLAALASLANIGPDQSSMTTYISEGLHFRGGSQTFPFWGMEWEIPVDGVDGKRDYQAIQRAWWDGISAIYSRPDAPVRAALEMRLMGGSSVLLAPQRHNTSTASIEVFTTLTTPPEEWRSFRQLVVDHWTSYKDATGGFVNARPHWAKQWWDLEVRGMPIETYLKETAYRDAFEEFRSTFDGIVKSRGGDVSETIRRFGNKLMERLIFE